MKPESKKKARRPPLSEEKKKQAQAKHKKLAEEIVNGNLRRKDALTFSGVVSTTLSNYIRKVKDGKGIETKKRKKHNPLKAKLAAQDVVDVCEKFPSRESRLSAPPRREIEESKGN